jgi:uncharacterized protein (DUF885 family)
MRNLACLLLAASVCSSAHAQDTSLTERVAQQNALFEELYQAGLKNSPERATSVGDDRYNAQLSDASLAQIERQHSENNAFLARLRAIPTTGMAETDRVSHELLERQHEGVPGHHTQVSVAQQLQGLPKFRVLSGGGLSAYTEGWALYAEDLGKEVGLYKDPVSDYGRLSSELFRAVRLVVDTGIHKGWTRDQVIAYMLENDVNEVLAQTETDRYIARPAQALAYKMGQLKIRELRERQGAARTALRHQRRSTTKS